MTFLRPKRAAVLAVAALIGAVLLTGTTNASTPSTGTVTFAHPSVKWASSTPMNGAAPAYRRITCYVPTICDDFTLHVDRGKDLDSALTLDLKVSSGNAMSIYLYMPDCPVGPTSACYLGEGQHATLLAPPNGRYVVRVTCDQCAAGSYTASATLSHFKSKLTASAASVKFNTPVALKGQGLGEPGIASDGHGNIVAVSLTGGPAVAANTVGIPTWVSHDDGKTWAFKTYGSNLGGWDTDVAIAPDDGTIYIADLEVAGVQVCKSTDHGKTFTGVGPLPDPNGCTSINTGQTSPSDDRQWLTTDKGGRLYVSDHEFNTSIPTILRSDNHGDDLFTAGPCGPIITDPNVLLNAAAPLGGTLVSRPAVDSKGNIYMLFTTPTPAQTIAALPNSITGTYSNVYVAISNDGCLTWKDYTVFDGSKLGTNSVQFGDIFNNFGIDGAGNLYAVAAGYVGTTAPTTPVANIYLFSSSDRGLHWTGPTKINTDVGAHMLPAIVGGRKGGQLALGYFRTTNLVTNPNDPSGLWTYTVAQSPNATLGSKATWAFSDMGNGHIYHAADICNSGIFCGLPVPGAGVNRNLADFTSATLDSKGAPIFVFEGDNPQQLTYVTKQTCPCFAQTLGTPLVQKPLPKPVVKPVVKGLRLPGTGVDTGLTQPLGIALLLVAVAMSVVGISARRRVRADASSSSTGL